jgi:TonB family protein
MRFLPAVALFSFSLSVASPLLAQDPPPPLDQNAKSTEAATESQDLPKPPDRIRMGDNVAASRLLNRVQPMYPPLARQTRISGKVSLHVIISKEGTVSDVQVVSGHPLLLASSIDAVRQWRYEPMLLNGQPVEVDTTVDVVYVLDQNHQLSIPNNSGVDPQLRADILHLFEVIHFRENAARGGREIFGSLRPTLLSSLPSTPSKDRIADAYIDKLLGLMQSDAYTERVVAIYAKYFSDEDIKGLSQFYSTPLGQRFNAALPQLFANLSEAGQKIAAENLPTIFQELCVEFPELQDTASFCKQADPPQKSELAMPTRPPGEPVTTND